MWQGDVWVSAGGWVCTGASALLPVAGGGGWAWGGVSAVIV